MSCKECKYSIFYCEGEGICTNPLKTIYEIITINNGEVVHADSPPPEITADNCCNQFNKGE